MPLIDRKALAVELGLSPRTIERWSTRPGFPVHRLGHARRYSLVDVLGWFQRGNSLARPKPPPIEADARAVELLVKQAHAAGYRTEGIGLKMLVDRVGASSAIASSLVQARHDRPRLHRGSGHLTNRCSCGSGPPLQVARRLREGRSAAELGRYASTREDR